MAARAKNRKMFNWFLLLNQCINFEIILQEGSLSGPLLKFAQIVALRRTRWPPELKIEKPLKDFSSPEPEDGF